MPQRVINLAARIMQLMSDRKAVRLYLVNIGGIWYLTINDGDPERLG